MPRLLVNPGTPSAWEVQLRQGANLLGRGFANDFKIDHPSVSTNHCEITVDGGSVRIKDLGSTNGTFVNQAPVTEVEIQPGHSLRLGGVEMLLQPDAPANAHVPETQFIPRAAIPPPTAPRPALTAAAPVAEEVQMPPPPMPHHAHAPMPAVAVVQTAAAPPGSLTTGGPTYASQRCKFHPKTPARFRCNHCSHAYCELCVASRSEGGVHRKYCRQCSNECVPIKVVIQQAAPPPNFIKTIPDAFIYPLRGMGVVMLIFMTVFLSAAPLARGFQLYLQIIIGGYLFSYLQTIIQSTAMGEGKEPAMPDISNFADDIVGPFFQLIGTVTFCFGPAIALFLWATLAEFPPAGIAMIPAAILGCIYLPMAFLAVAMLDTVSAVNPMLVVPSIIKVIKPYLLMIFIICCVALLEWGSTVGLKYFFGTKGNTKDMTAFMLGIGAIVVAKMISIYMLTVNARLLGLLYLSKKHELGWFVR